MRKMKIKKKAISPVVATVLLIALVVIIALIIFLWFRGMVQEGVLKFGKNIKLVCDDVEFEATYDSGVLSILNGDIPIFNVRLKIARSGGNYDTIDVMSTEESWPPTGLGKGGSFVKEIDLGQDATGLTVLPILIGTSSKGKKTFICEGQYGEEVAL